MSPSPRPEQGRFAVACIALLVALPAILAASWLAVCEIDAARVPSNRTPALSFVDAIVGDQIELAFEHIRSGQDPNAPVLLRDARFTGGGTLMLRPLLVAVAYDREDSVKMLMSSGAGLTTPGNRFAICLATYLGHERLAALIATDGGVEAGAAPCPPSTGSGDGALLSGYVE